MQAAAANTAVADTAPDGAFKRAASTFRDRVTQPVEGECRLTLPACFTHGRRLTRALTCHGVMRVGVSGALRAVHQPCVPLGESLSSCSAAEGTHGRSAGRHGAPGMGAHAPARGPGGHALRVAVQGTNRPAGAKPSRVRSCVLLARPPVKYVTKPDAIVTAREVSRARGARRTPSAQNLFGTFTSVAALPRARGSPFPSCLTVARGPL